MITPIRGGAEPSVDITVEALDADAEGLDHDRPASVSWLPLAGLAVGLWSLVPPYAGPAINTRFKVEIADHVVPGVDVLAASAIALLAGLYWAAIFWNEAAPDPNQLPPRGEIDGDQEPEQS